MANEISLLVRADDIGMAHAGNAACIEVYEQGICRSVELMVPCLGLQRLWLCCGSDQQTMWGCI